MKVWAYEIFGIIEQYPENRDILNKLGEQGWELVHVSSRLIFDNGKYKRNYTFKREGQLFDPAKERL